MTDGTVMMGLGDYRFSLSSAAYDALERAHDYRWAKQDRMGCAPAYQFTGPDDETLTLSGTILPHYRGGLGQVPAMRAEAGKGTPLMLVDGLGRVWGRYCITKIRERASVFLADGVPLKVEFDVSLVAYGEDAATNTVRI